MSESDDTLPVNEIFGPTLQGEGPDIGRPCAFLRLHHCPVHCPGCDTAFTWNGKEQGKKMTMTEIELTLLQTRRALIGSLIGLVVSGGEPLLYAQHHGLRKIIQSADWDWTGLETSGFAGKMNKTEILHFIWQFSTVCVSPKITPCLHGRQSDEVLECNLPEFVDIGIETGNVNFKFVVRTPEDVEAVLRCNDRHNFLGELRTYLMPYGNDRDEILRCIEFLIPTAVKYGFIITPRLHSLLWGAKRGV